MESMKLTKHRANWLVVFAVIAGPLAGLAAEEMKSDPLMEPVKTVYDDYLAIQKELAKDSLKGVNVHARAIAKAVQGDEMKMLPADVAKQAGTLANATELKAAREAFKPLSVFLVKYLSDHKAGKGMYYEAYCPMAHASWLQTEKEIRNPYYGKSMLDCGTLKN